MTSVLIQHMVKDFAAWKIVFDSSIDLRTAGGELSAQVYRDANEPNKVTTIHNWNSLANAQNFAHSPELKAGMEKAGVVGVPTVSFLNGA